MKKYIFSLLLVLTCPIYSSEMEDVDSDSDTETMSEVKTRTEEMASLLTQFLVHVRSAMPKTPEDADKTKTGFLKTLQNKLLLSSCFLSNIDEAKKLLESGADVNFQSSNKEDIDYEGYTCLMHAAENKNTGLIKLLLKYNPDLELKDKISGGTALFKSLIGQGAAPYPKKVEQNCIRVAKLLLDAGADINARNKDFDTVLIKHARMGNLEIVKFLVFNGASTELRDAWGDTAFDFARRDHPEVANFLKNYSAIKKTAQKIVNKAKHEIRTKEILRNTLLNKDIAGIISDYCDEIE